MEGVVSTWLQHCSGSGTVKLSVKGLGMEKESTFTNLRKDVPFLWVMRLVSVLVFDSSLTVIFSFAPSTTAALSALEASLAYQLRQGPLPACDAALTLCCQDHPVALQRKGELLYAVATAPTEDELGGEWACAAAMLGRWEGRSPCTLHVTPHTHTPLPSSPPTSSAVQLLSSVYKVIAAACEKEPPTTARLTSFYGKVVVCLHEAFSGQGYQLQRNLETILRNAKLKAPL